MNDILLGVYIGFIIYGVCSLIVDIIVFCIDSLNRKQLGTLGIVWNIIIFTITGLIRPILPNEILFYILCIISFINLIISAIQLLLGLMTNE